VAWTSIRRFFIEEDGHFRIKRELRDIVLFASHSLLKDPPFSKLDLICCRNLLIYLDRELQQQACATFHYALNPGGLLFLGASEGADAPRGLFRLVNRDARIYQAEEIKKINAVVPKLAFSPRPMRESRAQAPASIASGEAGAHHRALEEAAPPSVLVDERYRGVHLSESAGRFLQHPTLGAAREPCHADRASAARAGDQRHQARGAVQRTGPSAARLGRASARAEVGLGALLAGGGSASRQAVGDARFWLSDHRKEHPPRRGQA
jgi:hypothetical protein